VLHGNLHTRVSDYLVTRTTRVAREDSGVSQRGLLRWREACRVNHEPQHSFAEIQEFNPKTLVNVPKFPGPTEGAKRYSRAWIASGLLLPNLRCHSPRKRDTPPFRPPPSIKPLTIRDQPMRTVQLSRDSPLPLSLSLPCSALTELLPR